MSTSNQFPNPREQQFEKNLEIFRRATKPGLHIIDLPTGTGKSYSVAYMIANYFLEKGRFDRVICLCIQNKLVDAAQKDFEQQIKGTNLESELIVVKNDLAKAADILDEEKFRKTYDPIFKKIPSNEKPEGWDDLKVLLERKQSELGHYYRMWNNDKTNQDAERKIRSCYSDIKRKTKELVKAYNLYLKSAGQYAGLDKKPLRTFALEYLKTLTILFPEIEIEEKKIWLLTVSKGLYGIDPILSQNITIDKFTTGQKTLVIFDESDQAYKYMLDKKINDSIELDSLSNEDKFRLILKTLEEIGKIKNADLSRYDKKTIKKYLKGAVEKIEMKWSQLFGTTKKYEEIYPLDTEKFKEQNRNSVFMIGNISQVSINSHNKTCRIVHQKNAKHLSYIHKEDPKTDVEQPSEESKTPEVPNTGSSEFDYEGEVKQIIDFTQYATRNIVHAIANIAHEQYNREMKSYEEKLKNIDKHKNEYIEEPSIEKEVHSLIKRLKIGKAEYFKTHAISFIHNPKRIKIRTKNKIYPGNSLYTEGIRFYDAQMDHEDMQHGLKCSAKEIKSSPEMILIGMLEPQDTSVILCSATADSNTVISNFNIRFLKSVLGERFYTISKEECEEYEAVNQKTLPPSHEIEIISINGNVDKTKPLPEEYKQMFSPQAIADGRADQWYSDAVNAIGDDKHKFQNELMFLQICYHFHKNDDMKSCITFQNHKPSAWELRRMPETMALVDGTYIQIEKESAGRKEKFNWHHESICITNNWEEVQQHIIPDLEKGKKRMLVTPYGSFKAGSNLQYSIPKDSDCLLGDNWETNIENLKKDWDAVFLLKPTVYLLLNDPMCSYKEKETNDRKALYNLARLQQKGCFRKRFMIFQIINGIMSPDLKKSKYLSVPQSGMLMLRADYQAWLHSTLEQAIGRICRTKNKNKKTYIMYDSSIANYYKGSLPQKCMTPEYRTFATILNSQNPQEEKYTQNDLETLEENATELLLSIINPALSYNGSIIKGEELPEDPDETILSKQEILHNLKQFFLCNPSIEKDRFLLMEETLDPNTQICYGNWKEGALSEWELRTTVVKQRLETFMKNETIKNHFIKNGYATSIDEHNMSLHPKILCSEYLGEMGEEAFKALLIHEVGISEHSIYQEYGFKYELADFIVIKENGERIAIDVKNHSSEHLLVPSATDIPISIKRKKKKEYLGFPLLTINMLKIDGTTGDALQEIPGIIDPATGEIIYEEIEKLKKILS